MKRSESDKLLDISIVDQFKKQTNQRNINQKLERKIYSILRTDRKIEKQYRHLKSTRNHQSLHPIHQTPNYPPCLISPQYQNPKEDAQRLENVVYNHDPRKRCTTSGCRINQDYVHRFNRARERKIMRRPLTLNE